MFWFVAIIVTVVFAIWALIASLAVLLQAYGVCENMPMQTWSWSAHGAASPRLHSRSWNLLDAGAADGVGRGQSAMGAPGGPPAEAGNSTREAVSRGRGRQSP
jgi:hypothetical protein